MTPSAYEMIMEARRLIDLGWTQEAFARNAAGAEVSAFSHFAVRWSLTGALDAATARHPTRCLEARIAVHAALHARDATSEELWNDDPARTQADALALLDDALPRRVSAAGGEVLRAPERGVERFSETCS